MDNITKLNLLLAYHNKGKNDLAELLSVSSTTVTRWLDGTRTLSDDRINQICTVLNITRNYFDQIGNIFAEPQAPYHTKPRPEPPTTPEIQRLQREVNELEDRINDKNHLIKLLQQQLQYQNATGADTPPTQ